jgi:hypothetical protein
MSCAVTETPGMGSVGFVMPIPGSPFAAQQGGGAYPDRARRFVNNRVPKIANRTAVPLSSSGEFQVGLPAAGERLPVLKWQTTTEDLGTRLTGGVEIQGARIVQTSEDDPQLIGTQEKWASDTRVDIRRGSVRSRLETHG